MRGFIQFIEGHVIPGILDENDTEDHTGKQIADAASKIIDHCQMYPEQYFQHDIFTNFISRMKALVLLYGRVPFLHGSKIEDIAKLHSPLKNDMLVTIQAIPWAAKELNICFMRSAGETDAKPAIDAAAKSLESDSLDEQTKGLRDVISGYTSWSMQVRKTWLEDTFHGKITHILTHRVKEVCGSMEAKPTAPLNTPENIELVALLKDVSSLWSDVRVSMLMQQLAFVTASIDRQEAIGTFIKAIKHSLGMLEGEAEDDVSIFKDACMHVTASLPLRSLSLLVTSREHKKLAIDLFNAVTSCAFKMLRDGIIPEVASLLTGLCTRVVLDFETQEHADGDEEEHDDPDAKQLYNITQAECK